MQGDLVLVTGGSGYVGSWLAATLARRGHRVRVTLRSRSREAEVRAAIARESDAPIEVAFCDLLADDGWDDAVRGVHTVFHVATAMRGGKGEDIEAIAREGTRRVIEAASRAGVRRVIVTSSIVAALPSKEDVSPYGEERFTDLAQHPGEYNRSKTLAEKDAWDLAERAGMPLTTILPGLILGPLLGDDPSESLEVVGRMLRGKMPASPDLGFSVVDVRDLAELHVLAMESDAAVGQRFVAASDFVWVREIAALLRAELGDAARRAPTRTMPDWLLRLAALFDPPMKQLLPNLGLRRDFTSAKAERMLGWTHRPTKDAVLATARSFLERGRT